MAKYYVDTCIWRDYYEDRKDGLRPLGEFAFQFFKKVLEKKNLILYSDCVIMELKKKLSYNEINSAFKIVKGKGLLKKVRVSSNQIREARIISKDRSVAFGDALHAVLARDNEAIVITRDKHFKKLEDISENVNPEELV